MSKSAALFSGGVDSIVLATIMAKTNSLTHLIFFDYGQVAADRQWVCTQWWGEHLAVEPVRLTYPYKGLMSPHTTTPSMYEEGFKPSRPHIRTDLGNAFERGRDWSFIPGRNAHFILHASVYAYNHGCNRLYVGFQENELGLEKISQPDRKIPRGNDTCDTFIRSMNEVLYQSIGEPFVVAAPLLVLPKQEVVALGRNLGIDFRYSYSCEFFPPCLTCDQCNEVAEFNVLEDQLEGLT